jgi:hypothetical protein
VIRAWPSAARKHDLVCIRPKLGGCGAVDRRLSLCKRAWPNMVVEPNNLSVQIHALRKALGAYRDLVQVASGRGYRLAIPVQSIATSAERTAGVPALISSEGGAPVSEYRALQQRGHELWRLPDQRTRENEMLRDLACAEKRGPTS